MSHIIRSLPGTLLLAAFLVPAGPAPVRAEDEGPDLGAARKQIFEATNQFRKEEGRHALKVNDELARTAQDFADFMARTDKYGHTADGKQPWERAKEHGYKYCIVSENIAWQLNSEGFTTRELSNGFIKGWKESPPHRKNMLDPDVYEIGVGVAHSAKSDKYYAVQNFGRPRSMEIKFTIANKTRSTATYTLDGKEYSIQPNYIITHETCRPPELTFDTGSDTEKPSEKGTVFHPREGSRFVIKSGAGGKLQLQEAN